ncbi:hypothetical protein ACFLTN_01330 [Chloroflexota bacterium]
MSRIVQVTIILALLAALFGLGGCSTEGNTTNAPLPLVSVELSFPHGAPRLNQTAELRCLVELSIPADNITLELNLPDGLELVSGDFPAHLGTMTEGEAKEINAIIRPVEVGNYTIEVKRSLVFQDPLVYRPGPGLYYIYLSVSEHSAEWGTVPPWIPKGSHPVTQIVRVDEYGVIKTDLEISHAPKLNEPAKLFVTILSPVDFSGLTAEIIFHQGAELLEGAKKQPVDLKAGVPVHLSATIVFRETGYHTVTADVAEQINNVWHNSPQDTIYLKIGVNESTFESEPQVPEPSPEDRPPPPAISPYE